MSLRYTEGNLMQHSEENRSFTVPKGDEFALGEYTGLEFIQFYDDATTKENFPHGGDPVQVLPSDHAITGSARTDLQRADIAPLVLHERSAKDVPEIQDEPRDIEVFDNTSQFIDIYSIPDNNKEQLLLEDFSGDKALARQFVNIISSHAILRSMFEIRSNAEIMARQLVLIGQHDLLFGSRVIIPLVQPSPNAVQMSFIDRLRKNNFQQVIRGHVIHARPRSRKNVDVPKIGISEEAHTPRRPRAAAEISGIQFPQRVLANMVGAATLRGSSSGSVTSDGHIKTVMPSNISVRIDEIMIAPMDKYPIAHGLYSAMSFDFIGKQEERDVMPYDLEEPYLPHCVTLCAHPPGDNVSADANPANLFIKIYLYLRLLFQQHFFARPRGFIGSLEDERERSAPHESDFATEPDVVINTISQRTARRDASRLDYLASIAKLFAISLDYTHSTNIFVDFMSHQILPEYWRDEYDAEHSDSQSLLQAEIESRMISLRAANDYHRKLDRIDVLTKLIEDYFGIGKIATSGIKKETAHDTFSGMRPDIDLIHTTSVYVSNDDDLFAKMTPSERRFILTEYESRVRRQQTSALARACEHIALANSLRNATTAKSIAWYLSSIMKIIEQVAEPEHSDASIAKMRKCSLCGQEALCPHTIALARANSDNAKGITRQREREILAPYVESVSEIKSHYCRICGEYFAWSFIMSDDVDKSNPEDKLLATEIYHELIVIQRYVRARNVIDQNSFIRMIERHIYPFIEALESKLAVAQTMIAAEFSAKLRVFISIYAFADCIVNMARFDVAFDGFSPAKLDHIEALAVKYAINKIVSIENVALNLAPGITRDVISANLITAIGHLRNVSSELPYDTSPRDYRLVIMSDPVFSILFFNCGLQKVASHNIQVAREPATKRKPAHIQPSSSRPNPKDPFDYENAIFDLLPAKPQNPMNIYEPLFSYCKKRAPSAASTASIVIANLRDMYMLRAFDYPMDTTNRPVVEFRQRTSEVNAQLCTIERIKVARYIEETSIPIQFVIRPVKSEPLFTYTPGPLSEVYDENGRYHNWNILIFATAAHEISEVKLGDPSAFSRDPRQTKEAAGEQRAYIDKKCSVCGILQSKTSTFDESTIRAAIDVRKQIENFYQFFETRCPTATATRATDSGGIEHDFGRADDTREAASAMAQQCTKCGYSRNKARTLDRAYFDSFVNIFKEFIGHEHYTKSSLDGRRESASDIEIEKMASAYAARLWTFRYESIIDAASMFKIERHDIQTLGAREGMTREQISDESFVARVPKSRFDTRIQTLHAYISEIFMLYNIVKNAPLREKIRARSAAQFIIDIKGKIPSLENMAAEMPTLSAILFDSALGMQSTPSEFGDRARSSFDAVLSRAMEIFANSHKPMDIVNYYLEMICTILSTIASSKVAPQICSIFARAMMKYIIARENMTIKSDHVNISVIEGTKLADEEFDISSTELAGLGGYDDAEETTPGATNADFIADDDASTEADPFSLDAYDMDDMLEDDEIIDPDDTSLASSVHVGDEMGW